MFVENCAEDQGLANDVYSLLRFMKAEDCVPTYVNFYQCHFAAATEVEMLASLGKRH